MKDAPSFLLIANPDKASRWYEAELLRKYPHSKIHSISQIEVIGQVLDQFSPDLIICDYDHIAYDDTVIQQILLASRKCISLLLVTENSSEAEIVNGIKKGADDFISKPNRSRFIPAVQGLIEQTRSLQKMSEVDKLMNRIDSLFMTVIDSLGEGTVVTDLEENIIFANKKMEELLQVEGGKLTGRSFREFVDERNWDKIRQHTEKRKVGENTTYELDLLTDKGENRNVVITACPIYNDHQQVTHIFGIIHDFTPRKKVEDELRKLYTAVEQSPASIMITDREGVITYVNPILCTITGYRGDELLGKKPNIFKSGRTPAEVYRHLWETICSGHNWNGELENRKKNGELFWESVLISPVTSVTGEITHFIAVKEDITRRKSDEAIIRTYADVIENMQVGLYVYHLENIDDDRTLRMMATNPAASKFSGIEQEEMIGKTLDELFPNHRKRGLPQLYAKVVITGQQKTIEDIFYNDDGSIDKAFSVKAIPLPNQCVGVVFENITEIKKAMVALQLSERKFRELYLFSRDAIITISRDGRFLSGNPASIELFGFEDESSFIQSTALNHSPERQPDEALSALRFKRLISKALEVGSLTFEWQFKRVDGSLFYGSVLFNRLGDPKRNILQATIRDITAQKLLDDELKKNIQNFKLVNFLLDLSFQKLSLNAKLMRALVAILDLTWLKAESKGAIFMVNKNQELEMRVSIGLMDQVKTTCSIVPFGTCICGRAASEGEIQFVPDLDEKHSIRYEGIHPHGHYCIPIKSKKKVKGVLVLYLQPGHESSPQELTFLRILANTLNTLIKHNQYLDAIRNNETRLRTITETVKDVIIMLDNQGKIAFWNAAGEEIFGYSSDEVLGKDLHITLAPEQYIEKAETGLVKFFETGQGDVIGKPLEITARKKDGRIFPVELSISSIQIANQWHAIGIIRDISERKELEVQLRHAQKLESIGQLAAGIAHELNTPIQYVGDNVRFLEQCINDIITMVHGYDKLMDEISDSVDKPEILEQARKGMEEIDLEFIEEEIPKAVMQTLEGIERVTSIVKAMKEFSHPGETRKTAADINRMLMNTITVSKNEWKYVADLETDLDEMIPPVPCHQADLNQVFLNLIVNSAHAIESKLGSNPAKKGTIRIESRHEDTQVVIRVIDNGIGIPDTIIERVFDPFFTTKEVGKGTGQGLAISYNIITEKHKGTITIDSVEGEGATVTIKLPIEDV